jgi:glycosyltransferase involved in cell wall biosynthesis
MGASLLVLCDTVGHEGGTEAYLERTLPELSAKGVSVTIVARRVQVAGAFGIPSHEIAWGSESEASKPEAANAVASIIGNLAPDAVLTSNVFDEGILRIARRVPRFIVRLHDHRAFCPNGDRRFPQFPGNCTSAMGASCVGNAVLRGCSAGLHPKTFELLRSRSRVRDAMQCADAVVVSSEFMAGLCTRNGFDASRIVVAPPPLARESFVRQPAPRPSSPRLLFAGRIVPQKGLPSLVRALGHVAKERRPILSIAGEQTLELDRARELAASSGVQLEMLGHLVQSKMRDAIDASCAVAVPSLWAEPFGLIGIEAQARGRPAVAYAVGGIPEWIGSAGSAVPAGNERALANAIEDVTSEKNWGRYAEAAFKSAADFHPDHHIGTLRSLIGSS